MTVFLRRHNLFGIMGLFYCSPLLIILFYLLHFVVHQNLVKIIKIIISQAEYKFLCPLS